MATKTKNELENTSNKIDVVINPELQPLFSDHIFKIEIDENNTIVKLYFGHQLDNKLIHNNTIALPFNALLRLSDLIDSDEFKDQEKK